MIRALPPLLLIALDVYCLINVATSRDDEVRNLPRVVWFLLILLIPVIGSVVWLFVGRPRALGPRGLEYDRPVRSAGPTPESDEEFRRRVRERAEEQRRRYAEQQRAEQKKAAEATEQETTNLDDPDGTA